jgi:photosystem I P700 chlorophyll a apoprotein A2
MFTCPSQQQNGRCATDRYFKCIGGLHDIESMQGIDNGLAFNAQIFASHFGHLAVIFMFIACNLFHVAWGGNYLLFMHNPRAVSQVAHQISDLNITSASSLDFSLVNSLTGLYNWLLSAGFSCKTELYNGVIICQLLALCALISGKIQTYVQDHTMAWLHSHRASVYGLWSSATNSSQSIQHIPGSSKGIYNWPYLAYLSYIDTFGLRLKVHIGWLGLGSIAWAGHLVAVSIPVSRGLSGTTSIHYYTDMTNTNLAALTDSPGHVFGSSIGSGTSLLSFTSSLQPNTASIYLSDVAHHQLAIGVLCIYGAHLYASFSQSGFAHRIRDILSAAGNIGMIGSQGKSLDLALAFSLTGLACLTQAVASILSSYTPYPYLSMDYVTTQTLFAHHQWIGCWCILGSGAHLGIFLLRHGLGSTHTTPLHPASAPLLRLLSQRSPILSHLSYVSLLLGFHTLGIYVHNDSVTALGQEEKQLLIEPVFAQIIQELCYNGGGLSFKYNTNTLSLPNLGTSSPADLLVHHAIALGLHLTILILIKQALNGAHMNTGSASIDSTTTHTHVHNSHNGYISTASALMPDKVSFGYHFPCDGPGRFGTCDISAWDSVYLAKFWSLNTTAWLLFYFHWKHLSLWENASYQFEQNASYLNAWFRDYLWFNSAPLIRGYDALGSNDLSVYAWMFLAAHLCWATGFMFLISWRGYWEELIHIIILMHLKTPFLFDIWNANVYTPVALSILQARFIGLSHFTVGLIVTYAAFIIAATS